MAHLNGLVALAAALILVLCSLATPVAAVDVVTANAAMTTYVASSSTNDFEFTVRCHGLLPVHYMYALFVLVGCGTKGKGVCAVLACRTDFVAVHRQALRQMPPWQSSQCCSAAIFHLPP